MGAQDNNTVPELLYHTCLFVNETIAEAVFTQHHVHVIRTHSTLEAAKDFARCALEGLGYENTDFEVLEKHAPSTKEWNHPDGVVAYGKVPAGLEFVVSIDTKANAEKLQATPDGVLVLPSGVDHLHYVLQTTTDYSKDQHSVTDIQGAYVKRADAIEAAKNCLVGEDITEQDYAQYDVRDGVQVPEDWPFGDDVFVHAVAQTGENYLVAVRVPPTAAQRHGKAPPPRDDKVSQVKGTNGDLSSLSRLQACENM